MKKEELRELRILVAKYYSEYSGELAPVMRGALETLYLYIKNDMENKDD